MSEKNKALAPSADAQPAKRIHSLSSVFTFGQYKGLTVAAVIKFNARYLRWAVNNVPWFDLDAEARKAGQRAINAEEDQAMERQNAWAWGFGAGARRARESAQMGRIKIELAERKAAGTNHPLTRQE